MSELVEVPFEGGALVFATVGSTGPEAFTGLDSIKKATENLDEVLDRVILLGEAMARKLEGLDLASAEVSFGISFTGKGKFIIAEASANASLTFKLSFKETKKTSDG